MLNAYRIFQQAPSCHHRVDSCDFPHVLTVLVSENIAIAHDWNPSLGFFPCKFDTFQIDWLCILLMTCATVYCDIGSAGLNGSVDELGGQSGEGCQAG